MQRPLSLRFSLRTLAIIIPLLLIIAPSISLATDNTTFVQHAYLDLLGRAADSGGLSVWVPQLNSATLTRTQFALDLMNTDEYRAVRANQFYSDFLSRAPSSLELNQMVTLLQTSTLPQGRATVLGGNEYFSTQGGGTNAGFLNALFLDLLARPIDSTSSTFYQGQLAGTATRFDVALSVQGSDEWRGDIVNEYYQQFLHRAADPTGLSFNKNLLQGGGTEQQVIANILGSEEYFQNVPEPSSLALLAAALWPLYYRRRA